MRPTALATAVLANVLFAAAASGGTATVDGASIAALALPGRTTGSTVSVGELRGQVVMLNFWASWCVPCREEFPRLKRMYERYHAAGVTIVGVDVEPDSSDAEAFLTHTPVSFPITFDRPGAVGWSQRGYMAGDETEYLNQLRSLLREKSP